jgi:hypothetical protein
MFSTCKNNDDPYKNYAIIPLQRDNRLRSLKKSVSTEEMCIAHTANAH